MVSLDKDHIMIMPEGVERHSVVVTNKMQGTVQLQLQPVKMPDIKASLDRTELKENETATLSLVYTPGNQWPILSGSSAEIGILVKPINRVLTVRIAFSLR